MTQVSDEKRLVVFSGGSIQGITTGVMHGLRELLSPNIRNVLLLGMRREHYKLLIAQLRAEYEQYGAVITVNARPMYDTLDISWPMSDAVTIVTLKPDDLMMGHLRELSHDTRVFAITSQPLFTTQLFDYYDISRQLSIHTRIYTTGYVPEPGPLETLASFEMHYYVSAAKAAAQVTADINDR